MYNTCRPIIFDIVFFTDLPCIFCTDYLHDAWQKLNIAVYFDISLVLIMLIIFCVNYLNVILVSKLIYYHTFPLYMLYKGPAETVSSGGRSWHPKCQFLYYSHVFILKILSFPCFYPPPRMSGRPSVRCPHFVSGAELCSPSMDFTNFWHTSLRRVDVPFGFFEILPT